MSECTVKWGSNPFMPGIIVHEMGWIPKWFADIQDGTEKEQVLGLSQ